MVVDGGRKNGGKYVCVVWNDGSLPGTLSSENDGSLPADIWQRIGAVEVEEATEELQRIIRSLEAEMEHMQTQHESTLQHAINQVEKEAAREVWFGIEQI
jgi:hypothetical protein